MSCNIHFLVRNGSTPIVGLSIKSRPVTTPELVSVGGTWTEMVAPYPSAITASDGTAIVSLPWPSEQFPATIEWQLSVPGMSAIQGVVPEGVTDLFVHDLLTSPYNWGPAENLGPFEDGGFAIPSATSLTVGQGGITLSNGIVLVGQNGIAITANASTSTITFALPGNGQPGQLLTIVNGAPAWANPPASGGAVIATNLGTEYTILGGPNVVSTAVQAAGGSVDTGTYIYATAYRFGALYSSTSTPTASLTVSLTGQKVTVQTTIPSNVPADADGFATLFSADAGVTWRLLSVVALAGITWPQIVVHQNATTSYSLVSLDTAREVRLHLAATGGKNLSGLLRDTGDDSVGVAVNPDGTTIRVNPTTGKLEWLGTSGFANPMTTPNDLIIGGTAGAATRLPTSASKYLQTDASGTISWGAAPSGGGGGAGSGAANYGLSTNWHDEEGSGTVWRGSDNYVPWNLFSNGANVYLNSSHPDGLTIPAGGGGDYWIYTNLWVDLRNAPPAADYSVEYELNIEHWRGTTRLLTIGKQDLYEQTSTDQFWSDPNFDVGAVVTGTQPGDVIKVLINMQFSNMSEAYLSAGNGLGDITDASWISIAPVGHGGGSPHYQVVSTSAPDYFTNGSDYFIPWDEPQASTDDWRDPLDNTKFNLPVGTYLCLFEGQINFGGMGSGISAELIGGMRDAPMNFLGYGQCGVEPTNTVSSVRRALTSTSVIVVTTPGVYRYGVQYSGSSFAVTAGLRDASYDHNYLTIIKLDAGGGSGGNSGPVAMSTNSNLTTVPGAAGPSARATLGWSGVLQVDHGGWATAGTSGATGIIVIPVTGPYSVSALLQLDTGFNTLTYGEDMRVEVRINGAPPNNFMIYDMTSLHNPTISFMDFIDFTAGDQVEIRLYNDNITTNPHLDIQSGYLNLCLIN